MLREFDSPFFTAKAKSFLDIIMIGRNCGKLFIEAYDSSNKEELPHTASKENTDDGTAPAEEISAEELARRFTFKSPDKVLETLPEKLSVSRLYPDILDGSEDNTLTIEDYLAMESDDSEAIITEEEEMPPTLPSFITGDDSSEAAKRGIATHQMMQFCDFELLEKNGTRAELARLVEKEFLSDADAKRVRIKEIDRFLLSPLFGELKRAKKLYRELRFNVKLPASLFTLDVEKKDALKNSEILTQGVIDCVIENERGELHLIDYKTDRLTREELENPSLGEERLIKAHRLQLSYYVRAIELMFGRKPTKVGVYSLHLAKEVEIKDAFLTEA